MSGEHETLEPLVVPARRLRISPRLHLIAPNQVEMHTRVSFYNHNTEKTRGFACNIAGAAC
jgi:hypothetical protein